jgi:hypothetical protein
MGSESPRAQTLDPGGNARPMIMAEGAKGGNDSERIPHPECFAQRVRNILKRSGMQDETAQKSAKSMKTKGD